MIDAKQKNKTNLLQLFIKRYHKFVTLPQGSLAINSCQFFKIRQKDEDILCSLSHGKTFSSQ